MKLKKAIGVLLSVSVIGGAVCMPMTAQAAKLPNLLAGDANRDGIIDIRDVTEIQRMLANLSDPDEMTRQVSKNDFSRGELFIGDATNIQQHLAEFNNPSSREVGKPAYIWRGTKYYPALEEYQRYLDQNLDGFDFNGVAYVTRNGRVLCQATVGKANKAEDKDVTIDTLFPVGSASKQFCAASIMMLQEQGKLSVTDKLGKYFPEYEIGKDITLHQMLSMRSGIRDYCNSDDSYKGHENPMDEFVVSEGKTDEENMRVVLDWLFKEKLKFTPGKSWSYSNSNFMLLAMIVEQVSGMSYTDFVRENIFKPLNMTDSIFYDEIGTNPNVCEDTFNADNPYYEGVDFDNIPFTYTWLENHTKGDGDIVTNAKDIDKWMTSLRECTILSEESIAAMSTNYEGSSYGYGLCIEGDTAVYHPGDISSFESTDLTVPGENINIFIVTNNVAAAYAKNLQIQTIAGRMAKKVLS